MAKKNFTWKLDEDLVSKIQKLAEKEHRSLTNYIEVMFIERASSVAVGGKKKKDPHEVSKVKCDLCGKEWIAVRPEGLTKLECPNCENMVQFENV